MTIDDIIIDDIINDYIEDYNTKKADPILKSIIQGEIPLIWFGDMEAYYTSDKKVVTVGINPSYTEFENNPGYYAHIYLSNPHVSNDLKDLFNNYFKPKPKKINHEPHKWFEHYKKVLNLSNLKFSYDDTEENRALHIDLCTAIATKPKWGKLNKNQKKTSQTQHYSKSYLNI